MSNGGRKGWQSFRRCYQVLIFLVLADFRNNGLFWSSRASFASSRPDAGFVTKPMTIRHLRAFRRES